MFFGKPEYKNMNLAEIKEYNLTLFQTKVKGILEKGEHTDLIIKESLEEFKELVNKFLEIDSDPDMEYLINYSPSFVKSQKDSYCKHLIDVLNVNLDFDDNNRYRLLLFKRDFYKDLLEKILKSNARFKPVIMGYSKFMDSFKKYYGDLEGRINDLSNILGSKSNEYDRFEDINNYADSLSNLFYKRKTLFDEISEIKSQINNNKTIVSEDVKSNLDKKFNINKDKLDEIEKNILEIKNSITYKIEPLKRVARKHDHIENGKSQISDFLNDPFDKIKDETAYNEFKKKLYELKSNIETGKIDVKNRDLIIDQINDLIDFDLYQKINELERFNIERNEINELILDTKSDLNKTDNIKEDIESLNKKIDEKNKSIHEINANIEQIKGKISYLFLNYYKINLDIKEDN